MQSNIFLNFLDSLRISKLGLKVNTPFFYSKKEKQIYHVKDIFNGVTGFEKIYVPAYTDADLNTLLPGKISLRNKHSVTNSYDLIIYKSARAEDKYFVEYKNTSAGPSLVQQCGNSEVQAKAEMILFLHKKGLLK